MEIEEARKRQQAKMDAEIEKFKAEQKAVCMQEFIFIYQFQIIIIFQKEQKKIEEKIDDYQRMQEGKSKLIKVKKIYSLLQKLGQKICLFRMKKMKIQ